MTMWPYNVLEKSSAFQWVRAIGLLVVAPGLGAWMLTSGQCSKPLDYIAAMLTITMGVLVWGSLVVAVVRHVRTGEWESRRSPERGADANE